MEGSWYMTSEYLTWYDKHLMLHLHIQPSELTENGILFSVEQMLLFEILNKIHSLNRFEIIVKAHKKGEGTYYQSPYHKNQTFSHDNSYPLFCYSYKHDLPYHKEMKIWGHFWYPIGIILFSYLRDRWYDKWAKLFIWVVGLYMIQTCGKSFKYRYHTSDKSIWAKIGKQAREIISDVTDLFFNWVPTGVNRIIHTDGKLISFVIGECLKDSSKTINWAYRKCNETLDTHEIWGVGEFHWEDIFKYYFKDENHPNNKLVELWKEKLILEGVLDTYKKMKGL